MPVNDGIAGFGGRYVMTGISLPVTASTEELTEEAARRFRRAADSGFANFRISKLSVDARKKNDVRFVVSVMADYNGRPLPEALLVKHRITAVAPPERPPLPDHGLHMDVPPVVVGFGPAGMFAALVLAQAGLAPVVLERGPSVDARVASVERFFRERSFDPESNIQFGAGGAGTFSDGKLVTRVNDGLCSYVLERFAEFGAPEEILWRAKPHIGTDRLRGIVAAVAARIESLGGTIRYNCRVEKLQRRGDAVCGAVLSGGEVVPCGALLLAIGHSARDTYRYLIDENYALQAKPFSVGVRIEHLQSDIDDAMYGRFAALPGVPHAEYALSCRVGGRGVYTFCMCPGGEVVAAASEPGGVVTNGMSRFSRDGRNANAAVAVSVEPSDFGASPAAAMEFQRSIESAAFHAAGGNYAAPSQTVGSFLGRGGANRPSAVLPSYLNGAVEFTELSRVLPAFVTSALGAGLTDFGRKIAGFDRCDAVLTGPETRTSAPLRILRGDDRCALGSVNLYPAGEGAGYAGGITSAAIDGIRSAVALAEKFAEPRKTL